MHNTLTNDWSLEALGLRPHHCKTVSVGERFGKVVVLAIGKPSTGYVYRAICRCDCGTIKVHRLSGLQLGTTRSCGCTGALRFKTHGLHKSPLYVVWRHMMDRCYNPECVKFHDYGGRGIAVCERWRDLVNFHADMAATYAPDLMLERKNNELGYSPENCEWATRAAQQRNRRNNILVTMNGKTQVLQDWCNELGVRYQLAWERIRVRGWEPVRALTTPARPIRFQPRG